MKLTKIVILAMIFAFATSGMALAGSHIQANQTTEITASVQNTTNNSVRAAVKLVGYDDAGVAIGHLCQEVWLERNNTRNLTYAWKAPSYATGVYWSSKVDVGGDCVNRDETDYTGDSDSDDSDGDVHDSHDTHDHH